MRAFRVVKYLKTGLKECTRVNTVATNRSQASYSHDKTSEAMTDSMEVDFNGFYWLLIGREGKVVRRKIFRTCEIFPRNICSLEKTDGCRFAPPLWGSPYLVVTYEINRNLLISATASLV
jgi:hypothetical protein